MRSIIACCAFSCAACAAHAEPAAQLKEITVTAGSDALEEQRAAVTQKTVLDRKEIESLGGLTVGEVIRKLPGVEAGEHGADGGMSARARGMTRDSVQFLVNGERPTANARYALTQVGRMPAGELDRVEILRGASAEFGGAAPVTVNLVMRTPVARASTSLKAAIGQRGKEANGQFVFSRGGGEGGFSWLLPVTLNHHGMPVDQAVSRQTTAAGTRTLWQDETERGNYSVDELILSPRLAWKAGSDNLTLWPSYYRNSGRRATVMAREAYANPAAGTGLAADGGRNDRESSGTQIARVRIEGEKRVGESKLSGRAAVMNARRHADRDRASFTAAGAVTAWNEAERRDDGELSAALRLDRPLGADGAHFVSTGIDFARHRREDAQSFSGAVTGDSRFSGREQQWSLWLQDEWSLRPGATLTAGLRGETMALTANGTARRHGAVDPSLALRWDAAPGWVARASAGGAIRFPKLDELTAVTSRSASANTPLEPDRGGNPALRPERILNLEAGIDRNLAADAGIIGANVYLRRTRDFVERRQTLEGARWTDRPWNEGDARHWGLELSAKLRDGALPALPKSASLRAQLTLPRGDVDDARLGIRRAVRDMPSHAFSLGYEQSLPTWQSTAGFQLQRNGPVRSRVGDEASADTRARNLLDAHLVRRLDASFNLRLAVQNIFRADTRRLASAASGTNGWLLETAETGQRTWLLSLEGKW